MVTLEDRLRDAAKRVRAKGFSVEPGQYGVILNPIQNKWVPRKSANRCMCPLGALVVVEQPPPAEVFPSGSIGAAISRASGRNGKWALCFSWVFDKGTASCGCEACLLALKFREELLDANC
jgi:hypothetical protein